MKKKDIVKTHCDFDNIIRKGKKVYSKYFVIYYKDNNISHSRYGISVGTKLGNAVFRNKYKRRIRMILHNNSDLLYNRRKDYIVLLRKNGADKDYNELSSNLRELINELKEK